MNALTVERKCFLVSFINLGMTITYALMEKLEDMAKSNPDRVVILKKAAVNKLIRDSNGTVVGVEYSHAGKTVTAHGPVIVATGGYAADFSSTSLLKKHRYSPLI